MAREALLGEQQTFTFSPKAAEDPRATLYPKEALLRCNMIAHRVQAHPSLHSLWHSVRPARTKSEPVRKSAEFPNREVQSSERAPRREVSICCSASAAGSSTRVRLGMNSVVSTRLLPAWDMRAGASA
eukprot:6180098-Pleurochrysis_carterae.AAC.1